MADRLTLIALDGIPLVKPGDDLAALISAALVATGETLRDGDVLVVAQKIVSKSEGRLVDLRTVTPGAEALELAPKVDKDPRLVEVILRESKGVVRFKQGVLIVEQNLGLVMANAGVDHSNVETEVVDETALLLPVDPDASAGRLRAALGARHGVAVGVIINDSIGRAWRNGTVGHAIGIAGLPAVADLRGNLDLFGRVLRVSEEAGADELAAAAQLVQGQAAEGRPVALVRGFASAAPVQPASALIRPRQMDLFR